MTTKILAPQYLRIEREMRGDMATLWRALTDLHELRAWWEVAEMISLTQIDGGVRVTVEQTNFESFRGDAVKIFGYHKTETSARLERLQAWLEQRVPANLGQIPVV
jgi:uncharacterized protein YndB with AHSA1/START domain